MFSEATADRPIKVKHGSKEDNRLAHESHVQRNQRVRQVRNTLKPLLPNYRTPKDPLTGKTQTASKADKGYSETQTN